MHAPATPGDSVPGDAAGDDSGQGSGSSEQEQPADTRRIDSIQILTKDGLQELEKGDRNHFVRLNPEDKFTIVLNGDNLSVEDTLALEYNDGDSDYRCNLARSAESTSTRAVYESEYESDLSKIAVMFLSFNDGLIYDMRQAYIYVKLTVLATSDERGTVTGSGEYKLNSEVPISATPKPGSFFEAWSDNNSDAERTVTVIDDTTIVANFLPDGTASEPEMIQVTLLSNKDFGEAPVGSGLYPKGTRVIIVAPEEVVDTTSTLPYPKYSFYQWSDGNTERRREITVNTEITLTAMYH